MYIGALIKINFKRAYSWFKASIFTIFHKVNYSLPQDFIPAINILVLKGKNELFQSDFTTIKKIF